jgi:hypothetical protein
LKALASMAHDRTMAFVVPFPTEGVGGCILGCYNHPSGGYHNHYSVVVCFTKLVDSNEVGTGGILYYQACNNFLLLFVFVTKNVPPLQLPHDSPHALTPHLLKYLPLKTKQHTKNIF